MSITKLVGLVLIAVTAPIGVLSASTIDCNMVVPTPALNQRLNDIQKLRTAGHFDQARAAAEQLAAQNPGTFRVLYFRALTQADKLDYADAEKSLNVAIALQDACMTTPGFKRDFTVYNTLGWLQMIQGNAVAAEKNYTLALSHSKELTLVSVARTESNLGALYFSQGNFNKARPFLSDAAKAGNANADSTLKAVDQAEKIYSIGIAK